MRVCCDEFMHVCAFVCCPDNFSNSHEGSNSGQGGKERRTNKHDQQFIRPKILNSKVPTGSMVPSDIPDMIVV